MTTNFRDLYFGKFYGVLMWKQFDAHWAWLNDNPNDWYVWDCLDEQPKTPLPPKQFKAFLVEAEEFVRQQDSAKQCGFMYIDAPSAPTLLKVFDPKRMGSACGCSGEPILPRWTISKMKPCSLTAHQTAPKEDDNQKSSWWQFGKKANATHAD